MEINNIIIVDDHALLIDGIVSILKEKYSIRNVVACCSPEEAIRYVTQQRFDLYILDLGFRTDSNIDIRRFDYVRQISKIDPLAKIIVYTMREDFAMISLLKELKHVKGIVLKGPEKKYLQEAVKIVLEGGNYLCPRFKNIHKRSDEYRKRLLKKRQVNGVPTDKERTIIRMIAAGLSSEKIAVELRHTTSTIESYRRDLKVKFNVSNTLDLVIMAILLNYISLDDVALNLLAE